MYPVAFRKYNEHAHVYVRPALVLPVRSHSVDSTGSVLGTGRVYEKRRDAR